MNLRSMAGDLLIKEKLFVEKDNISSSEKSVIGAVQHVDNGHSSSIYHHASHVGSSDVQLINSPSRPVRRNLSNEFDDDDFQMVTNKKSRHLNNSSGCYISSQHTPQDLVMDMVNGNNMNGAVLNVSNDTTKVINSDPNLQKQMLITSASTRYALTRYPFPPHIVRFNSKKITINRFKEFVMNFFKSTYDLNIEIVNCRFSSLKCTNEEIDVLLYVKDPSSFAFLLDHTKWPGTICDEKFIFPSCPMIPPQLSLIIKNVDLRLDFDDFSKEVKNLYPDVKNIIRMKNKFGNDIKLVKLELTSPKTRNDLLKDKKIFINYICYDIVEYLAPVNVLICSK
jgi:hypothetical protein